MESKLKLDKSQLKLIREIMEADAELDQHELPKLQDADIGAKALKAYPKRDMSKVVDGTDLTPLERAAYIDAGYQMWEDYVLPLKKLIIKIRGQSQLKNIALDHYRKAYEEACNELNRLRVKHHEEAKGRALDDTNKSIMKTIEDMFDNDNKQQQ